MAAQRPPTRPERSGGSGRRRSLLQGVVEVSQGGHVSWTCGCGVHPTRDRARSVVGAEQVHPVDSERGRCGESAAPRRFVRVNDGDGEAGVGEAEVVKRRPQQPRRLSGTGASLDHQELDVQGGIIPHPPRGGALPVDHAGVSGRHGWRESALVRVCLACVSPALELSERGLVARRAERASIRLDSVPAHQVGRSRRPA